MGLSERFNEAPANRGGCRKQDDFIKVANYGLQ